MTPCVDLPWGGGGGGGGGAAGGYSVSMFIISTVLVLHIYSLIPIVNYCEF